MISNMYNLSDSNIRAQIYPLTSTLALLYEPPPGYHTRQGTTECTARSPLCFSTRQCTTQGIKAILSRPMQCSCTTSKEKLKTEPVRARASASAPPSFSLHQRLCSSHVRTDHVTAARATTTNGTPPSSVLRINSKPNSQNEPKNTLGRRVELFIQLKSSCHFICK